MIKLYGAWRLFAGPTSFWKGWASPIPMLVSLKDGEHRGRLPQDQSPRRACPVLNVDARS